MVINMKEILIWVRKMVKVNIDGHQMLNIKEIIKIIICMDLEYFNGQHQKEDMKVK